MAWSSYLPCVLLSDSKPTCGQQSRGCKSLQSFPPPDITKKATCNDEFYKQRSVCHLHPVLGDEGRSRSICPQTSWTLPQPMQGERENKEGENAFIFLSFYLSHVVHQAITISKTEASAHRLIQIHHSGMLLPPIGVEGQWQVGVYSVRSVFQKETIHTSTIDERPCSSRFTLANLPRTARSAIQPNDLTEGDKVSGVSF